MSCSLGNYAEHLQSLLLLPLLLQQEVLGKQQIMHIPRAPKGTCPRMEDIAARPVPRSWKVLDQTLFRIILIAALLAPVLGDCGPPPHLLFASSISELSENEYQTGTILKYTCRPGYTRNGLNPILTCKPRGLWSYDTFCVKKRCRNPGDLPNGQVEVKTDFSFGSQIEFSCSEGYILIGSTTSHCDIQEKGVEWSDPLPKCEIVKCEPPPNIINGKHNGGNEDIHTYGSSVTYSCNPRFSLLGEASISCTVKNKTVGVWSPSPPVCKEIICSPPNVPHGKIISGFGPIYNYKDSIMYTCIDGFVLRGSSLIHCELDSKWNPSPPVCELNSCLGLPNVPHASQQGYQWSRKEGVYSVGTELRYKCRPGYRPVADEPIIVTCQEDLRWSPFAGCEAICCPPPQLDNGAITEHSRNPRANNCTYFFGDIVVYSCYQKQRPPVTCRADGTWSPHTPLCGPSCDSPPPIAHGYHTPVSSVLSFTQEVEYDCEEGYTLVGERKLSCSSSIWSKAPPQCKALCPKPEITNGKLSVVKAQYVEKENLTVRCDSGYGVVGSPSITCTENRNWQPEVPKCEWEVPEGCEQVQAGRRLMQCLADPYEVKMALEVYKLSLEIELLELQRDKARKSSVLAPL